MRDARRLTRPGFAAKTRAKEHEPQEECVTGTPIDEIWLIAFSSVVFRSRILFVRCNHRVSRRLQPPFLNWRSLFLQRAVHFSQLVRMLIFTERMRARDDLKTQTHASRIADEFKLDVQRYDGHVHTKCKSVIQ